MTDFSLKKAMAKFDKDKEVVGGTKKTQIEREAQHRVVPLQNCSCTLNVLDTHSGKVCR